MSIFWYFLMALGFLIMVMLSVPDEDTPQPPPAIEQGGEQGTAAPSDRSP